MYYVFDRAPKAGRWIGGSPYVEGLKWRFGRAITILVPDPLQYELQPLNPQSSDDSPHMPAYLRSNAPLFRDDLVAALRACGVDNIDTYNTAIRDPDNGHVYTNYKAVNIIGLIAAADMSKSVATVHPGGPPLLDVDFDSLVIDPNKALGLWMFRLAESNNAIIVHEKLRDCLLERGFGDDIIFYDPREVAL